MELAAHEIRADEVRVGDVMEHRTVSLSGGRGRVVEAKVVSVEPFDDGRTVEIALDDDYAVEFDAYVTVVAYRLI